MHRSHFATFLLLPGAVICYCAAPCHAQYYSRYYPVPSAPVYVPATQVEVTRYAPQTVYYVGPQCIPVVNYQPTPICACNPISVYHAGYASTYAGSSEQSQRQLPASSRVPVEQPYNQTSNSETSQRGRYAIVANSDRIVLLDYDLGYMHMWVDNENRWKKLDQQIPNWVGHR